MQGEINLMEERIKFFNDLCLLIVLLKTRGYSFIPFSFYRTRQEQEKLVAEGKSKTLNSKHCEWLACDLVLVRDGRPVWSRDQEYEEAGLLWETIGHVWGGRWESLNDIYHFEF